MSFKKLVIGLTGGIGSGKSTVASIFNNLGFPIISADQIAREIVEPNQLAYEKIIIHFGKSIIKANGQINRGELRKQIFKSPVNKKWLESLLHPLIRTQIESNIKAIETNCCLVEIPLLHKRESFPFINRVLVVSSELEQRRARVMRRDKVTNDEANNILRQQLSNQDYLKLADDVIENNNNLTRLKKSCLEIAQKYRQQAQLK